MLPPLARHDLATSTRKHNRLEPGPTPARPLLCLCHILSPLCPFIAPFYALILPRFTPARKTYLQCLLLQRGGAVFAP